MNSPGYRVQVQISPRAVHCKSSFENKSRTSWHLHHLFHYDVFWFPPFLKSLSITSMCQDILGPEFFSRRPAMLGYHGDKAALAQLVASTMPQLAERMGTTGLADAWERKIWKEKNRRMLKNFCLPLSFFFGLFVYSFIYFRCDFLNSYFCHTEICQRSSKNLGETLEYTGCQSCGTRQQSLTLETSMAYCQT